MLTPGAVLGGRYRLDERIASGGMGDVWRGTDEVLGRTVAIKVLLPALLEEPGFAERFRGEARTMATINHPGVVDVYDYGSDGGTAFLIMEYVEGDALSRTLSRVGRLTPGRTMALVAQAAEALHAAHLKGIVHRDVKPGNLLVRPNGTLVLTDFGIARSAQAAQLTSVGAVLGTASYISPEQASGQQATPLSDLYALGVVAYQCLAGRRPYEGDNPLQLAMCHVRENPPPLPGDIPPAARQIVERAMAKDPAARWPTAAAMAQVARQAAAQLAPGAAAAVSGPPVTSVPPAAGTQQVSSAPPAPPVMSGPPVLSGPPMMSGPPVMSGPPMMSGPPGPPVASGPPGSPAVSGPPSPPGNGTRIMTGMLPQGTRAQQVPGQQIPPRPGGFAKGAAGVPPAPLRQETGYAVPPVQPAGQADNRRTMLLVGGIAAVVVLICGAIGLAVLLNGKDKSGNAAKAGTTASHGTSQDSQKSDAKANICTANYGKQDTEVRRNLLEQGYEVTSRTANLGGVKGQVFRMSPCTPASGARVTIWVSSGRGTTPSLSASEPTDPDEQESQKSPEGKDLPTVPKLPNLNQSCNPALDTCPGAGPR